MNLKTKAKILSALFTAFCILGNVFIPHAHASIAPTRNVREEVGPVSTFDLQNLCDLYDEFPTEENRANLITMISRIDNGIVGFIPFRPLQEVTTDDLCYVLWVGYRCTLVTENPVIQERLTDYIMEHHIDVNTLTESGESLLNYAVSLGVPCERLAATLITQCNANVNMQDGHQNTPMHIAVLFCHTTMIDLLLRCNARTNILNARNLTPYGLAMAGVNGELERDAFDYESVLERFQFLNITE